MGLFDKTLDLSGLLKEIQDVAAQLRDESEGAGEAIGEGFDDGFSSSITQIKASSIKLHSAFKNLRDKITKQMQQFTADMDGRKLRLKIDFSDIDINSEHLQKKISNILDGFYETDMIDFDEKGSEKQFKNLIELYVKYAEKLKILQAELSSIKDVSSFRTNLQEQYVLAQRLNEIFQFLDKQTNVALPLKSYDKLEQRAKAILQIVSGLEDKTEVIDDKKVSGLAESLSEIVRVLREIKDAFAPLTKAFANEESAIHAMVNSNVSQLEELINKFKEVHDMVDSLSKKEFSFNTTNVFNTKQTQSMSSAAQFDVLKEKAIALLNIVNQLNNAQAAFSNNNSSMHAKAMSQLGMEDMMQFFRVLDKIDINSLSGKINGAETQKEIKTIIGTLESYKDSLLNVVNIINALTPNAINTSSLSVLDDINKRLTDAKNIGVDTTKAQSDVDSNKPVQQDDININTELVLTKIKTLREYATEELKLIRQTIEEVFNFSTIDPNLTNVQSITEKIYQQFKELQQNIKKLDFNIEAPNIDGVINAINVIKQEGEVAEIAAPKKDAFTAANQKLADSMKETGDVGKVAVEGVESEADAVEKAAKQVAKSSKKIRADQDTIIDKYKNLYGGGGKVSPNLASMFNRVLDKANIDVSSIKASFGTKSYKDDNKNIIEYDYIKLIAEGTDALGKATTETREYEVATGGLIKKMASFKEVKDTFNISQEVETANSKVAELENRMGSFKIDLDAVKKAAAGITDETSLDIFEKELDAANQKLKELKATLKSSKSLDPVVNSESMMFNLEKTVATYRESIKKFSDVDGFDELENHLTNITTHLKSFNNEKELGNGKAMAEAVAEANKEIAKYNAQLNLVKARYQENNRVAKESEQTRKKALNEEKVLMKEISSEDKLNRDKDNHLSFLTKQQAQWEKSGQLTDEARVKINEMFDSLVKVTNS